MNQNNSGVPLGGSQSKSRGRQTQPKAPGTQQNQMVLRDNSQGSNHGQPLIAISSSTNNASVGGKQIVNKFINPAKMPMNANYVHRMSGGAPIDSQQRVNELLLESQKMIYAPPSREKTKQTMRSPLINKGKVGVTMPADEYSIAASNTLYQGQIGGRKKGSQTHQNAHFAASNHGGKFSMG